MKITCLATPNSKFGPYTIVYGLAAWPEGTKRSRGWMTAAIMYEREATPDEDEEQHQSPRFICYRNESWDQVVSDEAKYGIDANAERKAWRNRIRGKAA